MNALPMSILLSVSMAASVPALAKPGDSSKARVVAELKQALGAVAASAKAQDQPADRASKSQGAANANPRAILRVCSKDTPAAERAAICRNGVSPD